MLTEQGSSEHITLSSGKKVPIRLPSEKKIRRRKLVIFELDTLYLQKPEDKFGPEEVEKLLNFITDLTKEHEVVIYSENEKVLSDKLPKRLKEYVLQAPVSWESGNFPSRTAFQKQFYRRALGGREPREAIFIGNKAEFIWMAEQIGIISVYVPWGYYSLPHSATYGVTSVEQLYKFVGRKL